MTEADTKISIKLKRNGKIDCWKNIQTETTFFLMYVATEPEVLSQLGFNSVIKKNQNDLFMNKIFALSFIYWLSRVSLSSTYLRNQLTTQAMRKNPVNSTEFLTHQKKKEDLRAVCSNNVISQTTHYEKHFCSKVEFIN